MNSNLQNKLSRFEATPPPGAWDKIAEALDENYEFSQRLYNYHEQPKTNLWQKIETSLDVETAKALPITTRYKKAFRYIAAAAVIATIVIGVALLTRKDAITTIATTGNISAPFKQQQNNYSITQATPNPATANNVQNVLLQSSSNVDEHLKNNYVGNKIAIDKRPLAFIQPQNQMTAVVLKGEFIPQQAAKKEMFDFAGMNDYMVYSDGDGHAMKLPKKLFSLVSCPAGDESCKERIHRLQQKLSANIINADFTGILEMLRQLQ